MLSDEEIYRIAHFMMHEHGCNAELEAVTRGPDDSARLPDPSAHQV